MWLKEHGLRVRSVECIPINRLYIGVYKSISFPGMMHAVVCYNDKIVHDTSWGESKLSKFPAFKLVVDEYDW